MDHAGRVLQLSGHADQPGAEHDRAISFEHRRPHDGIGNGGLVFQRHEDDALGGARPLPHQHQAGDGDASARSHAGELLVAHDAAPVELAAQERHRMRLQRQMQMPIVLDHLLAEPHRRQRGIGLDLRHLDAREQRQIVLVARCAAARAPPTAPRAGRARASGRRRPPRGVPARRASAACAARDREWNRSPRRGRFRSSCRHLRKTR